MVKRDSLIKVKETTKLLADLWLLKKEYQAEFNMIENEMFQVELDSELKKLIKTHTYGAPPPSSSQGGTRSTATTDPLLLYSVSTPSKLQGDYSKSLA